MILLITNYNNNQLYNLLYSFILTYKILANITFENDNYRMGLLKKYIGKYSLYIYLLNTITCIQLNIYSYNYTILTTTKSKWSTYQSWNTKYFRVLSTKTKQKWIQHTEKCHACTCEAARDSGNPYMSHLWSLCLVTSVHTSH